MATRATKKCPIFGPYHPWPENALPTYGDMLKYFLFKRDENKLISKKDPAAADIATELCTEVVNIWSKSSIPCISKQEIMKKILDYHKQYRNLLKQFKGRQKNQKYIAKCDSFRSTGCGKLFDICTCKCASFSSCTCPTARRVPNLEKKTFFMTRGPSAK